jgi:hypothetical protein
VKREAPAHSDTSELGPVLVPQVALAVRPCLSVGHSRSNVQIDFNMFSTEFKFVVTCNTWGATQQAQEDKHPVLDHELPSLMSQGFRNLTELFLAER